MKLTKLGAALFLAAVLTAVLASSALAAAVTQDAKWYTGIEPVTELSGSETIAAEEVGTGTLKTEVSGTPVVLHMTGTKCVGCKIENSGGTAVGSGRLEFTGVTVEKPEKCTTSSAILTKALSFKADWMKALGTEPNYWKFVPTAGEKASFASFELVGLECPLETTITPEGSLFFQSVHGTGAAYDPQPMESSAAINTAAGGTFHVGVPTASLTSTVDFKLSGEKAGVAFRTEPVVAVTQDVKWYTGASPGTELSGSETMHAEAVGTATITTHVVGTLYEISATGVECLECKIENSEGAAIGSGKLKFTGVSMVQPAGCSVPSTLTTKSLAVQADWMGPPAEEPNYIRFIPTAGETTAFFTLEITGCAFSTTINAKGKLFVKTANATGIQAVEQEVESSEAIDAAAGGNLHLGTEVAALNGSMRFKMSGAKAGTAFGTH